VPGLRAWTDTALPDEQLDVRPSDR